MKKNLTKKLMLSVLTLAFAVVSLGASTFAWFTLSKDAQINQFEMSVKGGSGLEMRVAKLDGSNASAWYTSELPVSVIQQYANPGEKLDAVTATLDGDKKVVSLKKLDGTAVKPAYETGGTYVGFKVQFKLSDAADTTSYDLYLNEYVLATKDTSVDWTSNIAYKGALGDYAAGDVKQYYVSDAARLAITTADAQYIYESTDNTGHAEYTTGQPNADNAAVNYYNAITSGEENDLDAADAPQYATASLTAAQKLGAVGQCPDSQDYAFEITVYVWIEGWDGECINAIFAQTLQTQLSFQLPQAGEIE